MLPAGYVIGPDDVLQIVFWREKELSGDVVVRPDGRISLPLLNDVVAAGRTPDELRATLLTEAYRPGEKARTVYAPIRVAVTGSKVSPGLYESLELLGRERALERIRRGAEASG